MRNIHKINNNIYITSDEEIKVGDWIYDIELNRIEQCLYSGTFRNWKKIILTTDPDLIAYYGVQKIDDEFLKWFVKNPSCEEVKIESWQTKGEWDLDYKLLDKWQERMYSEEDMRLAFETGRNFQLTGEDNFNELIEQFKKK